MMLDVTLLMAGSAFPEDSSNVPDFRLLEDTVGDSDIRPVRWRQLRCPTKSDALSCIDSPVLCII